MQGRGPRAQAIVDLGARPGLLSETTKMTFTSKQARRRSPTRDFQVGLPARRAAVELLDAVLGKKQPLGEVLSRSLDAGPMFDLPQRDRALARAIVATSLRRKGQLDIVIDRFLERGMPEKAGTLYPILLSGAAQLIFLKTPPHAAIDLAVTLAQYDPRARRYDKLVNAVLRRVAEHGEAIAAALDATRVNTPDWLWARWERVWGEERTRAIAEANLVEPPLDLTVKRRPGRLGGGCLRPRAADPQRALSPQGTHRVPPRLSGRCLVGAGCRGIPARAVARRPSRASVSPISARRPAARRRSSPLPAPPSSRSMTRKRASVCSPKISRGSAWKPRSRRPTRRHGSPASVSTPCLLDAPCSSTGTIRRHPDIPYTKSARDIAPLAALQARLLDNAASLLKPGGTLVYSVCSLEPEEGEAQVAALLGRNDALRLDPVSPGELRGEADWIWPSGCLRTFPYQLKLDTPEWSGMDGFFAARLIRAA